MNKEFTDLLRKMEAIHSKKQLDYSASGHYENFERSALVSNWFTHPVDRVFVTLITTKLARLATLLNSDSAPNNEPIEDSFLDLTVYCGLWASSHKANDVEKPYKANDVEKP